MANIDDRLFDQIFRLPALRRLELREDGPSGHFTMEGVYQRHPDSWLTQFRERPEVEIVLKRGLAGDPALLKAMAPACNVTELDWVKLDAKEAALVQQFPNLRRVHSREVTKEGLAALRGLPRLESLRVRVHPGQLGALQSVVHENGTLEVELFQGEGEPENVSDTTVLKSRALRWLQVGAGAMRGSAVDVPLGPNLRELFGDAEALSHLRLHDGIRHLKVRNGIGHRLAAQLGDASGLQRLTVQATAGVDEAFGRAVGNLRKLYELRILDEEDRPAGSDVLVPFLDGLPQLVGLTLGGKDVTDTGLASFPERPRMASLDLSGARVTNRGIMALPPMPELRTLRLARTLVDQRVVPFLVENFPLLAVLELDGVALDLEHMNRLVALKHLSEVSFDATGVSWEEYQAFNCATGGAASTGVETPERPDHPGPTTFVCTETYSGF
ncbi:MAG: hypothetical protein AAGA56_26310 [Myxococcota bacterium]